MCPAGYSAHACTLPFISALAMPHSSHQQSPLPFNFVKRETPKLFKCDCITINIAIILVYLFIFSLLNSVITVMVIYQQHRHRIAYWFNISLELLVGIWNIYVLAKSDIHQNLFAEMTWQNISQASPSNK